MLQGDAQSAASARLDALRSRPRRPGEASTYWFEPQFGRVAVKVAPGEHYVSQEDLLIMTTLGSCVAACLWDRDTHVGGMNHFMLPDGDGETGRYGAFAMELLINEILKRGARRGALEAKVFGGGQVIAGMHSMNVGQRNVAFVMDYLHTERIPVLSKDVLDQCPRKVCFIPTTGKAMVKRLSPTQAPLLAARERTATAPQPAGTVDLF